VKLVELSGGKKGEYLKNKINELEANNKKKNIMDLYRSINEFKKGYQPRTKMVKRRMVICLQIPTVF
jgi:prefoldin subunit 5